MNRTLQLVIVLLVTTVLTGSSEDWSKGVMPGLQSISDSEMKHWDLSSFDVFSVTQETTMGPVWRDVEGYGYRLTTESRYVLWPNNWWFPELNYIYADHGMPPVIRSKREQLDEDKWQTLKKSMDRVLKPGWFTDQLRDIAESWRPPFDLIQYRDTYQFELSDGMSPNVYVRYTSGDLKAIVLGEFNMGKAWMLVQCEPIRDFAHFKSLCVKLVRDDVLQDSAFVDGELERLSFLWKRMRYESDSLNIYPLPKLLWIAPRSGAEPMSAFDVDDGKILKSKDDLVLTWHILIEVALE